MHEASTSASAGVVEVPGAKMPLAHIEPEHGVFKDAVILVQLWSLRMFVELVGLATLSFGDSARVERSTHCCHNALADAETAWDGYGRMTL